MSKSAVVFLADGCEPLEVVAPTSICMPQSFRVL